MALQTLNIGNNFSSELPSDFQKQFLEGFESCYTIKREDVM